MNLSRSHGLAIVLRRPHYRQVGDELYFLISRRPHIKLSAAESAVWAALDGEPTVDELRARFSNGADSILQRFTEFGLCEIAATDFRKDRHQVLVFEPHSDDAVLSVGGTMWLRRQECEFILITIGSRSNFTSYYDLDRDYFDVDRISSLRDAEGTLFARVLGGQYRALKLREAALRYHDGNWSLDWFRQNRFSVSAFISHRSGPAELRDWIAAIRTALIDSEAREVWFPLGSPHTDHQLTRDAALSLMRDEPALFHGRDVRFYQDVPYAARYPAFTPTIVEALSRAGVALAPEIVPIASVVDDKLHLVSLYGSQFKLDAIRTDVLASAQRAGDGTPAERLWRIDRPVKSYNPDLIRVDEPILRHATDELAPWLRRHRDAQNIRLLVLVPPGRWAEDMDYLLHTFPHAQFEVYVAPAAAAEVAQFVPPRCRILPCDAGPKAWVLLALRLMFMRPAPTLFIAGEKRIREARLLSKLWLRSDPVVAPTMDHLVSALRQLAT